MNFVLLRRLVLSLSFFLSLVTFASAGDSVTFPAFNTGTITGGDTAGFSKSLTVSSVPANEYIAYSVVGNFVAGAAPGDAYSSTMRLEINNNGSYLYLPATAAVLGSINTSSASTTLRWSGLLPRTYTGGTPLSVRLVDTFDDDKGTYTSTVSNVVLTLYPASPVKYTFPSFSTGTILGADTTIFTKTLDTSAVPAGEYAILNVSGDFVPAAAPNDAFANTMRMELSNGSSVIYSASATATAGGIAAPGSSNLRWAFVLPKTFTGGPLSIKIFDPFTDAKGPYRSTVSNVSVSLYGAPSPKKTFATFNTGTLTGGASTANRTTLDTTGMSGEYVMVNVVGNFVPNSNALKSGYSNTILMDLTDGASKTYWTPIVANSGTINAATATTLTWSGVLPLSYVTGSPLSIGFRDSFTDKDGPYTSNLNNVVVTLYPVPTLATAVTSLARVDATPSKATTVNWLLTFASPVTGLTASNFSLSPTVTGASIGTPTTSNSGLTWTIPVTTGTGDGSLRLNLANATSLSSSISTTLPYNGDTYTIDKTAPTISIAAPSASVTKNGPITFLVTYADTNFNSSTLAGGNVTLNATGGASASIAVTGSGNTRTVTLSSITGNGTLGISIAAGTASDTAGNTAPASSASTTFTVDNLAPTITSALTASGTYNSSFSYTIAASDSPVSYNATTLPAGLNFSGATISGTPTAPGTYSVPISATDAAGNTGNGTLVITIAKASATVTLTGLNQIYNGSQRPITATTTPSGLTVDFTYNASATVPINAGSYSVVGTINNANYQGSASGTLAVAKASATVTLAGLNQIYNGSQRPVTATTTPSGLTVDFTYNASATVPINAGSYSVVGTINNANYQGSASGTLAVAKASANVTLAGLDQTYNGSQRPVTATTTPSGLTVDFTYNASATVPINAGSYSVVGTINNANYQGSASGTLAVAKVALTVTADSVSRAFGKSNPSFTATTTGFVGADTSAVITGAPTLSTLADTTSVPGTYPITVSLGTLAATNYSFSLTNGTLTVNPLSIDDWRSSHFTPSELLDPSISGPSADADGDGISNLLEFAFGTDPRSNASGPAELVYTGPLTGGGSFGSTGKPIMRFEPSANTVEFRAIFIRQNPAVTTGLTYTVQFSNDLSTWQSSTATPVVLATSGDLQMVSVPYPLFVNGKKARFFRVTVSNNL